MDLLSYLHGVLGDDLTPYTTRDRKMDMLRRQAAPSKRKGASGGGEGDGGEGGGGDPGGEGDQPKSGLTEEDVTTIGRLLQAEINKTVTPIAQKVEALSGLGDSVSGITTELGSLKELIASIKGEGDEGGEGGTDGGEGRGGSGEGREGGGKSPIKDPQVTALTKELAKVTGTLQTVQADLEAAREREKEALWNTREADRDRQLTRALETAQAVSIDGGIKYFREDVFWDEDESTWYLIDPKTKAHVSIEQGVGEQLPTYLKKPKTAAGGSGSEGPGQGDGTSADNAKNSVIELGKRIKESGRGTSDVAAYLKAKRQLRQITGGEEDSSAVREVTSSVAST